MRLIRRISSAFKEIPGGQMLGPTTDYALRLLRLELMDESPEAFRAVAREWLESCARSTDCPTAFPRCSMLCAPKACCPPVTGARHQAAFDITREPLVFPVPRSAALATMARAETGSLLAIAYSNMRGYGDVHPTVAELRVGYLPVLLPHPVTGELTEAGEVLMTECEVVAMYDADDETGGKPMFTLGYGACFGHNEVKAISMAILDRALQKGMQDGPDNPSEDPEFVLLHVDGVDSMGFASHYKMPHYVTFQSDMDRLRTTQQKGRGARMSAMTRHECGNAYNFGFLDEYAKKEVRRAILKAIAIPGYQVPYASREMPMGRGFGTGGLQLTLSLIGPNDIVKVIDQGSDDSVNAVNLRHFVELTCPAFAHHESTARGHADPVAPPHPGTPLTRRRRYCPASAVPRPAGGGRTVRGQAQDHARRGRLFAPVGEALRGHRQFDEITISHRYPTRINGHYVIDPSPIPRWDVPKLNESAALILFGAGREKKIYAVPPYTNAEPLAFDDVPFRVEDFRDAQGTAPRLRPLRLRPIPSWTSSSTSRAQDSSVLGHRLVRAAGQAAAARHTEAMQCMKKILEVCGLTKIHGRGCPPCIEATGPDRTPTSARIAARWWPRTM